MRDLVRLASHVLEIRVRNAPRPFTIVRIHSRFFVVIFQQLLWQHQINLIQERLVTPTL